MSLDYSVVIRTTGKAHEKYQALLDSIKNLVPQPKEVIVVLPEGYDLPEEKLGYEKYYFCPKGMVKQRMIGIQKCKSKYALICDDDVSFEFDFVQKLYEPIKEGMGSFSAGPLYSFLPSKGVNTILCILMGSALPTILYKNTRYVSVLKTTGFSYNRNLDIKKKKYYETQSVAWTCFFADLEALNAIKFEEEVWLDANGYSALDDQTMFYKAWLNGYKTIVVSDVVYNHLDARTSIKNNKPAVLYSTTFNRVVFWHRYVYSIQSSVLNKIIAKIAFMYRMIWMQIWDYISVLRKRMSKDDYLIARSGYKDGMLFLNSDDYKKLPSVIK